MEYIKQSGSERPNKSQQKREMVALKEHAIFLCSLKKNQQDSLNLSNDILSALKEYTQIKQLSAQKRHIQFVTRLLSEYNALDGLLDQLYFLQNPHLKQQQLEKQVENTLIKLLENNQDSIEQLFTEFPDIEKQQFRQLLRNAQKEVHKGKIEETEENTKKPEGKHLKKLKKALRELYT